MGGKRSIARIGKWDTGSESGRRVEHWHARIRTTNIRTAGLYVVQISSGRRRAIQRGGRGGGGRRVRGELDVFGGVRN